MPIVWRHDPRTGCARIDIAATSYSRLRENHRREQVQKKWNEQVQRNLKYIPHFDNYADMRHWQKAQEGLLLFTGLWSSVLVISLTAAGITGYFAGWEKAMIVYGATVFILGTLGMARLLTMD